MGSQSRATILLVEDDPGIARLERLRLERAGYTVATSATAEEGLRQVAEGGIDLIVLDQQLTPGTSGLEFFRQVKAAGYNVPAILVTGMQEENLLVEALRAGVRDFVPKTQHFLNHLEPIVTRVLDQVRTERELAESRIVARQNEERRRELEREIAHRKRVEQALKDADAPERPVPGHAGPRAPQSPGTDQQRRADHEGRWPERPLLPVVGQGHRGPDQTDDPHGRRPAGRLPDHARQGGPPEGADRSGGRGGPGRRGQPALDRGL